MTEIEDNSRTTHAIQMHVSGVNEPPQISSLSYLRLFD